MVFFITLDGSINGSMAIANESNEDFKSLANKSVSYFKFPDDEMLLLELSRRFIHYTFITIRCVLPCNFHFMPPEIVISPDTVKKVSYKQ
jgi:hypothetical protein